MPMLNPNHPVTQQLDDEFMHKIAAVLVMKAGGSAEVTCADLDALRDLFAGDRPTLVTNCLRDVIELRLIPESQAIELARKAGGLPQ